jgi:hypothetical protein
MIAGVTSRLVVMERNRPIWSALKDMLAGIGVERSKAR